MKVSKCKECGREFSGGRIDRLFCSDACRYRYHNVKTYEENRVRMRVYRALDRNYRILARLLDEKRRDIEIIDLLELGFQINTMTAHLKVNGHEEYRCYDIKYRLTRYRLTNLERVDVL